MNVIKCLQSALVRLRRMPRTRGFGVQSPSAYRFLRDVVSTRGRYAIAEVQRSNEPSVKKDRLKLLKFYARIANFTQAKHWFVSERLASADMETYVCVGCQEAQVSSEFSENEVYVIDADDVQLVDDILNKASSTSLLIIEGINRSRNAFDRWRQVMTDSRTGVCFDMYKIGVVFFDLKKYKTSYQVNL